MKQSNFNSLVFGLMAWTFSNAAFANKMSELIGVGGSGGLLNEIYAARLLILAVFLLVGLYFVGTGIWGYIKVSDTPAAQNPEAAGALMKKIVGGSSLIVVGIIVTVVISTVLGTDAASGAGAGLSQPFSP